MSAVEKEEDEMDEPLWQSAGSPGDVHSTAHKRRHVDRRGESFTLSAFTLGKFPDMDCDELDFVRRAVEGQGGQKALTFFNLAFPEEVSDLIVEQVRAAVAPPVGVSDSSAVAFAWPHVRSEVV